ncbi:hypothetical protein Q9233_004538 [Columba guinea]|nr:hypothetical protein Q9233_004538 [Columba guinea]
MEIGWGRRDWLRHGDGLGHRGFVRLVDGKSRCSGRVEIRDGNQWKTVCGSRFGPKAADMVCRELQCGVALPVSGGGSRTAQELFPEAVYEEIGHNPAWEKQARFGHSGFSSEQSLTQLQPYPGHREEEDGLASASDVPVLPGGDPVDGYDDAREVSLPGKGDAPGQGSREMPRVPEEGAGPSNAPRDGPEGITPQITSHNGQ